VSRELTEWPARTDGSFDAAQSRDAVGRLDPAVPPDTAA
jgi:hypothetical protein